MTLLICWLAFPLVLGLIALGCGLLLERGAGTRMAGALLAPAGLAVVVVAAQLATATDPTAELALPLVLVLAVAGFALSPRVRELRRAPRIRGLRRDGWAAAAAAGVYAVFAAPVVLSGDATVAGYLKLEDTATWLALTDRVMEHGRSLDGLAPSSYEGILDNFLPLGYPVGSLLPLGVARPLVGQDLAWLLQPYAAFLAAMLTLALYALVSSLIPTRPLRAAAVFVAGQSTLLLGYSLWGGVKEVAGAWILALLPALAIHALRDRVGVRAVLPLAVATAAALSVTSYGAAAWLAMPLLAFVVALFRLSGPGVAVRQVGALVGLAALLSVPALIDSLDFLAEPAAEGLRSGQELGALLGPLNLFQVFGIWPSGDFRLDSESPALTAGLIVVAGAGAAFALFMAWRRRQWELPLYVGSAAFLCLVLAGVGSPWVDGKTFAIASPAFLLAAVAGAATLFAPGRRAEAVAVALVIAGGVLWSNALAYREVDLAPRDQLAELEQIGERIEGQGPTLMTEYSPYGARHFLRDADPEGASLFRRRLVPLRNGEPLREGQFEDIDQIQPRAIFAYRTLVLRRSPAASRPPSVYRLIWSARYYEVWQRPEGPVRIAGRLPLGKGLDPGGRPPCRDVVRLARRAGPGGRLATVVRRPPTAVALARVGHPPGWGIDAGNPGAVYPTSEGNVEAAVDLPRSGRYGIWLAGSFRTRIELSVDGREIDTERHRLDHLGHYLLLGEASLSRGSHRVTLRYGGPDLSPGTGGDGLAVRGGVPIGTPFGLGPLVLSTETAARPVISVRTAKARTLCGKRLDWVEALRS